MLYKLYKKGIGGKFYNLIENIIGAPRAILKIYRVYPYTI